MNSARSTRSRRGAQQATEESPAETIPEEIKEEEMQDDDESNNNGNHNNDQEMKDEDGNESSSSVESNENGEDMEDEDEEEKGQQADTVLSPSPEGKKDMTLRSGRRKRRRSKETTGLTPPDTVSARKRSRRGTAVATASRTKESAKKAGKDNDSANPAVAAPAAPAHETIAEEQTTKPAAEKKDDDDDDLPRSKKARDSILQSDKPALAAANHESEYPSDVEEDDGRRLSFDAKPPPATAAVIAIAGSIGTSELKKSPPVVVNDASSDVPPEELEVPPPSSSSQSKISLIFWIVLYMVLIALSARIWIPLAGKLALSIVPLTEDELLLSPAIAIKEEEEVAVVDTDSSSPQLPAEILKGLAELEKAQYSIRATSESLAAYKAEIKALIKMARKSTDVSKRKLMIRFSRLMEAENVLQTAMNKESSPQSWKEVKKNIDALGLPHQQLVDASVIDMWQVGDPVDCPEDPEIDDGTQVQVVDDKDPPISPRDFEITETNLLLRATMTAEKIVRSGEAEANIRAWVRDKIDAAIEDEDEILNALEQIQAMSSDDENAKTLSIEMIADLLRKRLELEVADGTGVFDHAALKSGAKIIYGGKRGTTKSITDSLPLYNRLMQLANLRFYGHGPEAAITPTYPKNSLGQCWSFQPLAVKEQLKINQQDDHKHGSFGTLTISFANPVKIEYISIEHPTVTDHPKSAIRGFRLVGFADSLAEGQSQSMGSFQYRMGGPSIQKFPVADKEPIQSVSLAIDSNWGLEYACLYRFRVHGVAVED